MDMRYAIYNLGGYIGVQGDITGITVIDKMRQKVSLNQSLVKLGEVILR